MYFESLLNAIRAHTAIRLNTILLIYNWNYSKLIFSAATSTHSDFYTLLPITMSTDRIDRKNNLIIARVYAKKKKTFTYSVRTEYDNFHVVRSFLLLLTIDLTTTRRPYSELCSVYNDINSFHDKWIAFIHPQVAIRKPCQFRFPS